MYFGSYTCITKLIHVFQILYMSYRAYTCLTDLILVLQNLYMYFRSYTCVTKLILVFQILFMCEGTRRYDKSEQIKIISHARSDQTYVDTYQIWTLLHSRYRSQQIHIPDSYRFRTYPKANRFIGLYHSHIQSYTCSEVPVGTTGLILILLTREYSWLLMNLYLFY